MNGKNKNNLINRLSTKNPIININFLHNDTNKLNTNIEKDFTKRFSLLSNNIDGLNRESQLKILSYENFALEKGIKDFIRRNTKKNSSNILPINIKDLESQNMKKNKNKSKKEIINNKLINEEDSEIEKFKINKEDIYKKYKLNKNLNLMKRKKSSNIFKSKSFKEDEKNKLKNKASLKNSKGKQIFNIISIKPKRKSTELEKIISIKKKNKKKTRNSYINNFISHKDFQRKSIINKSTVRRSIPISDKILRIKIEPNSTNFYSNITSNFSSKKEVILKMKKSDEIKLEKTLKYSSIISSSNKVYYKNKEIFRRLQRSKIVYDSLSDDIEEVEDDHFLIYPKSYFKYLWDFFIMIIIIFSIFIIPLNVCFQIKDSSSVFIDVIFGIDLFLNFFMVHYDLEENLITNHKKIIINYLTSWFLIDFISFIPFNSLNYFDMLSLDSNYLCLLRLVKYFKIYNCSNFYCTKIIQRIFCFNKKIKSFFKNFSFYHKRSINLLNNIFRIIIILHILTCVWIYFGLLDLGENWFLTLPIQTLDNKSLYLSSLYFNFVSIFTVGYGDILPVSFSERLYLIFLLVLSLAINTYAVSFLENLVEGQQNLKLQSNIEFLQNIAVLYNIDYDLYEKILKFLKYHYKIKAEEKDKFIDNLPTSLKNLLICKMYKDIIDNFIFFKEHRENNIEFKVRILLSLRPIIAYKGEEILKVGEFLDEIIFVKSGRLSIFIVIQNINVRLLFMKKFEHFGESMVLNHQRSPVGLKVMNNRNCELLLLRRNDYINILSDYNENLKISIKKSEKNLIKLKKIIKKKKFEIKQLLEYERENEKKNLSILKKIESQNIDNNCFIRCKEKSEKDIMNNSNSSSMSSNNQLNSHKSNINLISNQNENDFNKFHSIKVTINSENNNYNEDESLEAPRDYNKLNLNYIPKNFTQNFNYLSKNLTEKKILPKSTFTFNSNVEKTKDKIKKKKIQSLLSLPLQRKKSCKNINKSLKKSISIIELEKENIFHKFEGKFRERIAYKIKKDIENKGEKIKIENRIDELAEKYFNLQLNNEK